MKAIILSAGLGTRLKSTIPKSLTILKNGKTILDYSLQDSQYMEDLLRGKRVLPGIYRAIK